MAVETSAERPLPVRAINQMMGGWVDRLGVVWVQGQLTNVSRGAGNYVYLVVRDELGDISLRAHAPRAVVDALPTMPVVGTTIVINAKPMMWTNRADLSLEVREIRLVGDGELLARLEQRRQLLAAEGLFTHATKQRLPFLPRSIGLVTARGSAAERDVLDNVRRRWPGARFLVRHALMQGARCAEQVMEASAELDRDDEVDVIVIARGGGSMEDLLPFSDEALVRHVHGLSTPVVSAIGHEQDQPILDLVADVRASTPTDAAKLVAPDVARELAAVTEARGRARRALTQLLERETTWLAHLRTRPVLADPRASVDVHLREIGELRHRARDLLQRDLTAKTADLELHLARVRALSPLSTLRRGYAIVADAHGAAVASAAEVAPGETLHVRLSDGRIQTTTTSVQIFDDHDTPGDDDD